MNKNLNFLFIKEQKGEEGRVIYIESKINGVKATFCNIYAPIVEDPFFPHKVNKLAGNADDYTIKC